MISTEVHEEMARLDADGPDDRRGFAGPVGAIRSVASLNLGLRVFVEVATIASLGYWGASINASVALRALLAVVTPLAAAPLMNSSATVPSATNAFSAGVLARTARAG